MIRWLLLLALLLVTLVTADGPKTCGSPVTVCPGDRHCVTGICVPD